VRSGIRVLVFVAVTVGILVALFFGLTRRYTVHSNAMLPTLKANDHVAVFRFQDTFRPPSRKDIVVLTRPVSVGCAGMSGAVARIVGMPGETVSEKNGFVSIDGKPLKESYVQVARREARTQTWHVPKDGYLVMGDNRRAPCASPVLVLKKSVVGTVFLTYWPVGRISIG
jgi:signal peptidase I